jgi:hypothetical protein
MDQLTTHAGGATHLKISLATAGRQMGQPRSSPSGDKILARSQTSPQQWTPNRGPPKHSGKVWNEGSRISRQAAARLTSVSLQPQ